MSRKATMEESDTPCDPSADFEAWVIQTRRAQGLPPRVEDLAVLSRIAYLILTEFRHTAENKTIQNKQPRISSSGAVKSGDEKS